MGFRVGVDIGGVRVVDGTIDHAATASLRASMQHEASNTGFDFGQARRDFETIWTERHYADLTTILARRPIHWRQFVKTRLFDAIGPGDDVWAAYATLAADFPALSA